MVPYSLIYEFDKHDQQTQSIIDAIFNPLGVSFHVALFAHLRIKNPQQLYDVVEDFAATQKPVIITPAMHAFTNQGYIGVKMDCTDVLCDLRNDLLLRCVRLYR